MKPRAVTRPWTKAAGELRAFLSRTLDDYGKSESLLPGLEDFFAHRSLQLAVEDELWTLTGRQFLLRGPGQLPTTASSEQQPLEDDADRRSPEEIIADATFSCLFDLILRPERTRDKLMLSIKCVDLEFSVAEIFVEDSLARLVSRREISYSPYVGGLDHGLQMTLTSHLSEALLTPDFLWNVQLLSYQTSLRGKVRAFERLRHVLAAID